VREAWVDEFAAALQQRDDGAYIGFLTDEGPARIRQAYPGGVVGPTGPSQDPLRPHLFHHNHNIPTVIAEPGQ
jgi:hypothetical protein